MWYHWLWLTHGVGCPDIMLHTYSDSKAWSPVMQECNVVSKRPTVAAPVMWDGLTDTVELLVCHQLNLNITHGEDRIQREQVSTISGTKHNSGVVRTCRNKNLVFSFPESEMVVYEISCICVYSYFNSEPVDLFFAKLDINVRTMKNTSTPYSLIPTICNNNMTEGLIYEAGVTLVRRTLQSWNSIW